MHARDRIASLRRRVRVLERKVARLEKKRRKKRYPPGYWIKHDRPRRKPPKSHARPLRRPRWKR